MRPNRRLPLLGLVLVTDLGYAPTAVYPDAVDLIVEGVDNFCSSPDADADLGLGGAISGTALAIGLQPAS